MTGPPGPLPLPLPFPLPPPADSAALGVATEGVPLAEARSCPGPGQLILNTSTLWSCLADVAGQGLHHPPPWGPFGSGWSDPSRDGCVADPQNNVSAAFVDNLVRKTCVGKPSCEVNTSEALAGGMFGDPCLGCNKVILASFW